jgi:hypothetical protein
MLKSKQLRICVALSVCALLAMSTTATAQQKRVSYEQAWKLCKQALDREGPATTENTNSRYVRGGACLAKYGYKF